MKKPSNYEAGVLAQAEAIKKRNDANKRRSYVRSQRQQIGKCYRYRNSYSCPEDEADYWWLYVRIDRVTPDGGLLALVFETDKNGNHSIRPDEYTHANVGNGYEEISRGAFKAALRTIKRAVFLLK